MPLHAAGSKESSQLQRSFADTETSPLCGARTPRALPFLLQREPACILAPLPLPWCPQMSKPKLIWKKKPESEDYEGALQFLMLIYAQTKARQLLRAYPKAKTVQHAAKDLLRASNLPLLPRKDPHVEQDLARIRKGKNLAPVLLVRGDMSKNVPLIVADGYHRICAICYYDENAPIPCRLVSA
jgi:hypothetical protein